MSVINISSPAPALVVTAPENGIDRFQKPIHLNGLQFTRSGTRVNSGDMQDFALGNVADPAHDLLIEQGF